MDKDRDLATVSDLTVWCSQIGQVFGVESVNNNMALPLLEIDDSVTQNPQYSKAAVPKNCNTQNPHVRDIGDFFSAY